MFKKFACLSDETERREIFSLLTFNLTLCLRLMEILSLSFLFFGLGWFISQSTASLGPNLGPAAAVALMLVFIALMRLGPLWAREKLGAAFGLSPAEGCLERALIRQLKPGLWLYLSSLPLLFGLEYLPLWGWTLAALALGLGLLALLNSFPRLWRPGRPRPATEAEIPAELRQRAALWQSRSRLGPEQIWVDDICSLEAAWPRLEGLGSRLRLVIPGRLVKLPPRELSALASLGLLAAVMRVPQKFLLLKICALCFCLPLAAILIGLLGSALWAYPLLVKAVLVILIWLALALGWLVAQLALNLTSRTLEAQLAASLMDILPEGPALVRSALEAAAAQNLEPAQRPAWQDFFRPHLSWETLLQRAESLAQTKAPQGSAR